MSTASAHGRDASRSPRRAGSHKPIRAPAAARLCAAGLVILATACIDAAGPERLRSTITFDVRALTRPSSQLGDGASVVGRAEIVVSRAQTVVLTAEQNLAPTDSIASFDIELDAGSYDFRGSVFSNVDTLLYDGSTSQAIAQDGFLVEIVPQAVNAVLVVAPRTQTVQFSPSGQIATAQIEVRNVGSLPLFWRLTCARVPPTTTCSADPSASTLIARATGSTTVVFPGTGTWELLFETSSVQTFSAPIGTVTIVVIVT